MLPRCFTKFFHSISLISGSFRVSESSALVVSGDTLFIGIQSTSQTEEFRGIQYAHSPTGSLRFKRPRAFDRPGPVYAREYGYGCPQGLDYTFSQGISEDCLFLNVVRPSRLPEDKIPVFVWIHGGANLNGQAAMYHGSPLVTQSIEIGLPVIHIAMNYRLNGFGFSASSVLLASGNVNLGLHDQEQALLWVRANIANFGGDPDRITIVGESAGSVDVWAHVSRQGNLKQPWLFAAAMMSGAPGGLWPHVDDASLFDPAFHHLVAQVGCDTTEDHLECLRKVDYQTINSVFNGRNQSWRQDHLYSTGIVEDGYWFDSSAWESLNDRPLASIPMIVGFNHDDGTRLFDCTAAPLEAMTLIKEIRNAFNDTRRDWAVNLYSSYVSSMTLPVEEVSPGGSYARADMDTMTAFYTDLYFAAGTRNLLEIASKSHNIWGYRFDQVPPPSAINLTYGFPGTSVAKAACMGAYHSSPLSYLLGDVGTLLDSTPDDVALSKFMIRSWLSLSYYGDPNGLNDPGLWASFSESSQVMKLEITNRSTLQMIDHVFRDCSVVRTPMPVNVPHVY